MQQKLNPKTFHIVNTFCDSERRFGNPVGIIIDENGSIDSQQRQAIAARSGFSEVVWINDLKNFIISIYNPQEEIAFAGHAVLGAAYFIQEILKLQILQIRTLAGICQIKKSFENPNLEEVFILADEKLLPNWNLLELNTPADIQNMSQTDAKVAEHTLIWAWRDKSNNIIQARTFAPDWGIDEDEANGSGGIKLCLQLQQDLTIIHGKGSIIKTKYIDKQQAWVGGFSSYMGEFPLKKQIN